MSSSAPGPEFIPLDNQLCFSLYATTLAINRTYKPMLDEMGITYSEDEINSSKAHTLPTLARAGAMRRFSIRSHLLVLPSKRLNR